MKTYIQRKDARQLETVDEFETRKEARAMLKEYRRADPAADHYLSNRPCKGWREAPAPATSQAARGAPTKTVATYHLALDRNGNRIVRVHTPGRRGFSVQTNGNLPRTHRDGVTPATAGEVSAYVREHGTQRQRGLLAIR